MPEGCEHIDNVSLWILTNATCQVIEEIGPKNFRNIGSDNTSNTTKAREMVRSDYQWILIAPDTCHRLQRLCGDICSMDYFKSVRIGPVACE